MSTRGKTKLCKHCQAEIRQSAEICPKCKKKQGGNMKWIIVAAVALIVIIAAVTGGSKNDKTGDTPTTTTENAAANDTTADTATDTDTDTATDEQATFTVGETAAQNDIQITLVSAVESEGSEYVLPDSENVFLLLEFEIANNSSSDINISSLINFEAYCDDYSVTQDIMGLQAPEAEGKNQLDGAVSAGKKMNGVIAYQIPAGYKSFEVSVSPDFWSNKGITFVINK